MMLYAFYIYIVFDFQYLVFVQYVNLYAFGTKTPDELVCSASHVFCHISTGGR